MLKNVNLKILRTRVVEKAHNLLPRNETNIYNPKNVQTPQINVFKIRTTKKSQRKNNKPSR